MDELIQCLLNDDSKLFLEKVIQIVEKKVKSGTINNEEMAMIMRLIEQKNYFSIIDILTVSE